MSVCASLKLASASVTKIATFRVGNSAPHARALRRGARERGGDDRCALVSKATTASQKFLHISSAETPWTKMLPPLTTTANTPTSV